MKKIVWLIVSFLMVLSLVLASCAPKVTEEKEVVTTPTEKKEVVTTPTEKKEVVPAGPEMVKLRLTKLDGTVVEKMAEKPRYGGTITTAYIADPASFDPVDVQSSTMYVVNFVYERLHTGDWTRSNAGTGEYIFCHFFYVPMQMRAGQLIESWEYTDPLTITYKVRKGIHWQNIPPVNGRELTAADIAYTILRQKASPRISPTIYGDVASAEATDKYTVVVKLKTSNYSILERTCDGQNSPGAYPREMVEKYGNLNEWRSACGTGAWMVEDYVRGSVVTFKRNPDYWRNDPLHPDNQLPYADKVKYLIIPDYGTQIAAMRSGKIDVISQYKFWQDAESLKRTNPKIKQFPYVNAGGLLSIQLRIDEPPFNDIRVRQAMTLAVDQNAILNDYLKGNGEVHNYPMMKAWGEQLWTPLDKMPTEPQLPGSKCSVRELYTYNPQKAKQLLAEAGYPNGFETSIITTSPFVDVCSLCVAYWDAIGVRVKIDVKDQAVFSMITTAIPRTYHGMIRHMANAASPWAVWTGEFVSKGANAVGNINDPHIDQTYAALVAEPDQNKRDKMAKELSVYVLENAYKVIGPHDYWYNFWQPWLKGCEGSCLVGAWDWATSFDYYWVDQDLKEEMTGSR